MSVTLRTPQVQLHSKCSMAAEIPDDLKEPFYDGL